MPSHYTADSNPIPNASGVYKITCTTTQRIYVGSTTNLRKRGYEHFRTLRKNLHVNPKLQAAWNKYGEQSFIFEVLELVLPPFLLEREQYWLDKLHPFSDGYNIAISTQSNHLGLKHSPESIAKMSANRRGKPAHNLGMKHTPEAREKMSMSKRGKAALNRGKKHTPEALEKMRLAKLGKKQSDETKRKQAEARKGRSHNAESIEKMRLAALRRSPISAETRTRMSNAKIGRKHNPKVYETRRKTFIVTSPVDEVFIVHGLNKFCQEHSLNCSHLIQVAQGKVSHHKGWKARYA